MRDWTGIDKEEVCALGIIGRRLLGAEFAVLGKKAYSTSVMQVIRNTAYTSGRMLERWKTLSKFNLVEPVLDYGCGVGFMLAFLHQCLDMEELYGYEVEGVQKQFLEKYSPHLGFRLWPSNNQPKVNTLICTNVLEHTEDPMELLSYLYTLTDNVIANCGLEASKDTYDIAPMEGRYACIALLRERGGLWETQ